MGANCVIIVERHRKVLETYIVFTQVSQSHVLRLPIQPNKHTDAHKCWKALTGANCVIIVEVERQRKVLETYSFNSSVTKPCT